MKYITLCLFVFLYQVVAGQVRFPYGAVHNQSQVNQTKAAFIPQTKDILPTAYSIKKFAPAAGNQSPYGECTAWSLAYNAMTIIESVNLNRTDAQQTTENVFSPSFLYNQSKDRTDTGCNDGISLVAGLNALKNTGVLRLSKYPYACGGIADNEALILAAANKIIDFKRLQDTGFTLIRSIKSLLANNNPVPFDMLVTPSFDNLWGKEYWNPTQNDFDIANWYKHGGKDENVRVGWHAMCLTGYDDNDQTLEIVNSWTTAFGKNGYIKVSYNNFLQLYGTCFMINAIKTTPENKAAIFKCSLQLTKENNDGVVTDTLKPVLSNIGSSKDLTIGGYGNTSFKIKEPLKENDRFRLLLNANMPMYVYLLNYNSLDNEADSLYPYGDYSPYIDAKDFSVTIPAGRYPIRVSGSDSSKEYFTALFSSKPLDIGSILDNVKRQSHNYFESLQNAVKEHMVDINTVSFDKKNGGVIAKVTDNNYILPLVIVIDHQ